MLLPMSLIQTWLCFIKYALKLNKCFTLSSGEVTMLNHGNEVIDLGAACC